jgi:hypothetical protein
VRYQGAHVVGIGRHERKRGHGAPATREHLDGASVERLDHGVHVVRLDRGRVVDPAVFAGAAAQAARVIGNTVPSGKCDADVAKPPAAMGWPIMNSGGRPSAVGSGPWTS